VWSHLPSRQAYRWLENAPEGNASWAFFMSERAALAASHGAKTQAQSIQLDEAPGIGLVIGTPIIVKGSNL
jgi:hypothetical protein